MLLTLLNVIYKPVEVHRYVQTSVRVYTSHMIFYLCWNYELKLHLLTLTFTSLPLS